MIARGSSVLSRNYVVFQSGPEASMQGAVRREYVRIAQGGNAAVALQTRSRRAWPLRPVAGVAFLGNGRRHSRRNAPCHRPQGTR